VLNSLLYGVPAEELDPMGAWPWARTVLNSMLYGLPAEELEPTGAWPWARTVLNSMLYGLLVGGPGGCVAMSLHSVEFNAVWAPSWGV